MTEVRLVLFGSPHVERDGRLLDMDTRKAMALLAYLAISGSEQPRDVLVALLYPESDPESARSAFRRTLSTLHSALGKEVLAIRRDAVGIAPDAHLWVDVLHFQTCLGQAGDLARLREAAQLYRDDFMAGFSLRDSPAFDDWQYHQTESLRRQLDVVLDRLSIELSARGDLAGAVAAGERRVRLDPLLEEAHRQLMHLYALSGQRGAALRQYRECVRILEQELGVTPLEATTHLYQEILGGRLEKSTRPVPESGTQPSSSLPVPVPHTPPLIGRVAEMAAMEKVLQPATSGGWFIAVSGEAGVGKTRLAEELLARARHARRSVAQASCYEGQVNLAYAPFLEAVQPLLSDEGASARLAGLAPSVLSEAVRLFPQLIKENAPPPSPDGPGSQSRFFESLRLLVNSLLSGDSPGILFLDDLHWADTGTLDLVAYLARRLRPNGFILLTAWRDEQGPVTERLTQLTGELQRAGVALHLPLARMKSDEIAALVQSIFPQVLPGWVDRLYQESEGLPFIALEYLHSAPAGTSWEMPGGVRALLHRRLQEPGEAARQLLSAAAVIGRSFDFTTLHSISGRSEWETITGLEELVRLGLVREQESSDYDFNHEKLRALAYEETSLARRRLLHQRTAEFLATSNMGTRDPGLWAGLAASHFLQGGQPQRAAEFFLQAGEHARRLHANQQALTAFQSALAAGHPDPAWLHEACGDLHTLSGEYVAAVASYQAASAYCAPGCLSNLMHKLGEVYQRRGEWDVAEAHYRAALESAGDGGEPAWRAHLFADWSLTVYRAGAITQAHSLAEQSLAFAEQSQDSTALAQSFNMLGILARAQGNMDQASNMFHHSLRAAEEMERLDLCCAALHNLARLEQERGRIIDALGKAQKALEYCTLLGDRHHQAALLNTLADLQHSLGKENASMHYLKQAVAMFAEIGEDVGWEQPEIWKLTEW